MDAFPFTNVLEWTVQKEDAAAPAVIEFKAVHTFPEDGHIWISILSAVEPNGKIARLFRPVMVAGFRVKIVSKNLAGYHATIRQSEIFLQRQDAMEWAAEQVSKRKPPRKSVRVALKSHV